MNAVTGRPLRALARFAAGIGASAALAMAAPAFATGGPSVRLDIVAVPASVTHSTEALPTFASYRMTITSLDHDRLKKLSFKGTVRLQGLPPGSNEVATLFGADGATCTLSPAGALECAVPGELRYRGESATFTVTLNTPAAGSGIAVSGNAVVFEYCCHWKQSETASTTTTLTAPDPDSFSTFVPASATTPTALYSGTRTLSGVVGAIPIVDPKATPPIDDPFTTTVIVPAGSAATTASVAERELAQSCSANPRCFESDLKVPGSFDFLTIILRRDRTTLISSSGHGHSGHGKGHDKGRGHGHDDDDDRRHSGQSAIDNAIVKYFPDDDPAQPDRFIIVLDCSVVPGGVPTSKNPCIASRKAYPVPKKGHHQKIPALTGLEGDWEFVIHALDNGRFQN
jgi:hypothetical protein